LAFYFYISFYNKLEGRRYGFNRNQSDNVLDVLILDRRSHPGPCAGVLSSQIGHLSDKEVVEVTYDTSLTNLKELVAALKKESFFYNVIVTNEEEFSETSSQVKLCF